jgi:putative ABC transport system substrate-binding protein
MKGSSVRRREFISILGGAAAWPLAGHAQQAEQLPRIGVLSGFSKNNPNARRFAAAFVQALRRFGWVDGKNVRIDYRYAAGNPTLFKTYARQLIRLTPDAILAITAPAVAALREQTHTIPIVFVLVPDPVGLGFVHSLARPGGNITGFVSYDAPIIGKWIELLKEIAPSLTRVAVLFNPQTEFAPPLDGVIEAASSIGVTATLAPVHDDAEIEKAVAAEAREPGGGLICLPDTFDVAHRHVIIAAAARHKLPLMGTVEFPRSGGLMSYTWNAAEQYAQAASYIDRILRGAKPADLPVQRPTQFSLIINLKTAQALGLTVPPVLLAEADEVIK